MKLIFCHPKYGHISVAENETVIEKGQYEGLTQEELFEKIMTEGYGGKVSPIFLTEFEDGHTERILMNEAKDLIHRTGVLEVVVVAPIAGGK